MQFGDRILRRAVLTALLATVATGGGCATAIRYAGELSNGEGGRSGFVTAPAAVGGFVGLVFGVGSNILLMPVTGPVYLYRKQRNGPPPDALSTLFFPTFVLWQGGKLIAAPFDAIEFAAWRAWQPRESLSRIEQEEIERFHDERLLSSYLVRPVFPSEEWQRERASAVIEPRAFPDDFLLRSLRPERADGAAGRAAAGEDGP